MALKITREDKGFLKFLRKQYSEMNEAIKLECSAADKLADIDLKEHLMSLESYGLKENDFQPTALKAVQFDFVGDLLYKYL